jgi:general secretion pathway protein A
MSVWTKHWGFAQDPFSKEIAAQDLWLPTHKEAIVERLVEACEMRTSALLVGEPGIGKTCMLRALQQRLPDVSYRLTYYHNATLGRRDFYRALCRSLGLQPHGSAASVFSQVNNCVQELSQNHLHPILVLDEAHMLHQEVLDHLHILLNFSWDSKALMSSKFADPVRTNLPGSRQLNSSTGLKIFLYRRRAAR